MTTFTIDIEDAKKAAALKKFLEAFEIPFQKKSCKEKATDGPYNPEFVEKILSRTESKDFTEMSAAEFKAKYLS